MTLIAADPDDIVGFTDAPTLTESEQLTKYGRDLFEADKKIKELEATLESTKAARLELASKTLPDFMLKIGQDKIGLADFDVDLVLEDYYHANIATDWEPERRNAAFQYLEENGNGDLVKTEFTILFPRQQLTAARWLQALIRTVQTALAATGQDAPEIPDPSIGLGVPWNTLTAFVKEQLTNGNPVDLEVLGATVGKIVKIKPRSSKPKKAKK
jgi:hypothetical protein